MSDSSSVVDDLGEELKCGICFGLYNNPRLLPCSHSYCEICLIQLLNGGPTQRCPHCQRQFHVENGDVSKLPVNLLAKNLVDKHRKAIEERDAAQGQVKELQLFYLSADSRHRTVTVKVTDTVLTLKSKISEKEGIPLNFMHISYNGKPLKDDSQQLKFYDLQNLGNIDVNRRVHGGIRNCNNSTLL